MSSISPPILLDERRFDVILLGTSLTNTILAAALAKSGKKVLHLDRHDYYGSADASLSYNDFVDALTAATVAQEQPVVMDEQVGQWRELCGQEGAGYTFVPVSSIPSFQSFTAFSPLAGSPSPPESERHPSPATMSPLPDSAPTSAPADTAELPSSSSSSPPVPPASSPPPASPLISQSRHFSLDLTPGVVLSRSALVELLILSNVSGYMDFKAVDSSYLCLSQQEGLLPVPISRSAVFSSALLSLNEKRQLMRLISALVPNHKVTAAQEERDRKELEEWNERPFADFLAFRDLSPRLAAFVAYTIALLDHQLTSSPPSLPSSSSSSSSSAAPSAPSQVTTREGVARMRSHILSIGRYGAGGFLYPIYSLGELPQAFARLCAVHGGVFILRFPPTALVLDPTTRTVRGLITASGQFLETDALVSDSDYLPPSLGPVSGQGEGEGEIVSSAVCMLDGPLTQGCGEAIAPLAQCTFPPHTCGNRHAVRCLQLTDAVKAAPPGLTVLHLYTPGVGTAEEDLRPVVDYLTGSGAGTWAPGVGRRPRLVEVLYHQRKVRAGMLPGQGGAGGDGRGYGNLYVPGDASPLVALDGRVEEAARMLSAMCPGVDLMTAMTAVGRGADDEEKEEMEELNILNAVIGIEETKEGGREVEVEEAAAVVVVPREEQRETTAYEGERKDEQKQPSAAVDEGAILDSLDDLTFD